MFSVYVKTFDGTVLKISGDTIKVVDASEKRSEEPIEVEENPKPIKNSESSFEVVSRMFKCELCDQEVKHTPDIIDAHLKMVHLISWKEYQEIFEAVEERSECPPPAEEKAEEPIAVIEPVKEKSIGMEKTPEYVNNLECHAEAGKRVLTLASVCNLLSLNKSILRCI